MSPQTVENNDPNQHTFAEKFSDSIQGKDEPMEDTHPEAPPLLVFATYPLVLILGIVVTLIVVWFTQA